MYYSKPVYVFWTGGYDSTFRICQLLIKEKVAVQPVYISDKYIDNHQQSNTRRKKSYTGTPKSRRYYTTITPTVSLY